MKNILIKILKHYAPVIALIVIYLFFTQIAPESFSSLRNLETIARQTAIVGTISLGMTFVIISGGVDLAVGSMLAMGTVIIALMLQQGHSAFSAAFVSVLSVSCFGFINGFIITRIKIMPMPIFNKSVKMAGIRRQAQTNIITIGSNAHNEIVK